MVFQQEYRASLYLGGGVGDMKKLERKRINSRRLKERGNNTLNANKENKLEIGDFIFFFCI